ISAVFLCFIYSLLKCDILHTREKWTAMETSDDDKSPANAAMKLSGEASADSGPGFLAARAVMEEFPCGCVAVDSAGLVVHANPPFVKIAGIAVARLKGRPLASLLTPAHREQFPDKLRGLFKKRGRARLAVEISRPGREPLAVELVCQPTLGRGFGRTLILAVSENRDTGQDTRLALEKQVAERTRALDAQIKERLRVEEALRESQERLTLALWGSNCVWWDLDLKEARLRNLRISLELMLTPMLRDLPRARTHQGDILRRCAKMIDHGDLRIHVSETFPLTQAQDAHKRIEDGHVTGKLVLTME
ncbi:MAG: PAS domain-containing protein, partial [Sphingobacteriia bacterium]|nr:PAS domain-containing protein [Sphingobacteriia bacterium]